MAGKPKLTPTPKFHTLPTGAITVSWTQYDAATKTSKTVRRGCDTDDMGIARDRWEGIWKAYTTPKPVAGFTLGALIDAYQQFRENNPDKTKRPSASFAFGFRPIRNYFGAMLPEQLSATTIADYRRWRQGQPVKGATTSPRTVSDNTAVRELKQLRAAIKWGAVHPAYRAGLVGVAVKLPDVELQSVDRAFSHAEVQRVLAVLETSEHRHLALFARLALATGGRASAILERRWSDVTFPGVVVEDESGMVVTATEGDRAMSWNVALGAPIRIDMGKGKGHKRRPSGMVDRANTGLWMALMQAKIQCKDPNGYIISLNHSGKRLGSVNLDSYYRKAGITDVTGNHVWKHTACTLMLLAGVDIREVAEHVNTSVEVIMKHYRNFLPAKLAERGKALAFA